jgi:hypothetical protein
MAPTSGASTMLKLTLHIALVGAVLALQVRGRTAGAANAGAALPAPLAMDEPVVHAAGGGDLPWTQPAEPASTAGRALVQDVSSPSNASLLGSSLGFPPEEGEPFEACVTRRRVSNRRKGRGIRMVTSSEACAQNEVRIQWNAVVSARERQPVTLPILPSLHSLQPAPEPVTK